eukprot:GFUD01136939.1.p1 GENE.GFUD01136939.1~~GFUD01136939.1.p1  ORF type:complete len:170 (-),score=70.38 GFUD01136939.1:244-726(-)
MYEYVVIDSMEEEEENEEEENEENEEEKGPVLRRSSRTKNKVLKMKEIEEKHRLGMMTRRRTRMRYNSMMDEDEQELDDQEEHKQKRKEPENRRENRMHHERVAPVKSPEDTDEYLETLNGEKTLVEILLRKYGFGSWTKPEEEDCKRHETHNTFGKKIL